MAVHLIEEEQEYLAVLEKIKNANRIALDTEFSRTKTYAPIVGLIQIEANGELFLIDPIAVGNIKALIEFIVETDALIILHAGHEDLEIIYSLACFYKLARKAPKNIFDTQIAASFLGKQHSVGLATLLQELFGIQLDKSETLTDWLARPFTAKQLEYAALDIAYLRKIQEYFMFEFQKFPEKYKYFQDEMNNYVDEHFLAEIEADKLYLFLKTKGILKKAQLSMLKEVCRLRYQICIEHNLAPSLFMNNETMVALVKGQILDVKQYAKYGVHYRTIKKFGEKIVAAAQVGLNNKNNDILPCYDSVKYIKWLQKPIKELHRFLENKAEKEGIAKELLNTKRMVYYFFWRHINNVDKNFEIPILERGWRRLFLGDLGSFLELAHQCKLEYQALKEQL